MGLEETAALPIEELHAQLRVLAQALFDASGIVVRSPIEFFH